MALRKDRVIITTVINEKQQRALGALSKRLDLPRARLHREAIDLLLAKHKKKLKGGSK